MRVPITLLLLLVLPWPEIGSHPVKRDKKCSNSHQAKYNSLEDHSYKQCTNACFIHGKK